MFIHFSMATFGGDHEGTERVSPTLYAPSALDVGQWVHTVRQAGMKYAILTTCHGIKSGFCLWPAENDEYNVARSGNRTDVVAAFMNASKAEGIKPGLYYALTNHRSFPDMCKQIAALNRKHPDIYLIWFGLAHELSLNPRHSCSTRIVSAWTATTISS